MMNGNMADAVQFVMIIFFFFILVAVLSYGGIHFLFERSRQVKYAGMLILLCALALFFATIYCCLVGGFAV